MKRHEFDPVSLVTGLVFLAVAAAFLLDAAGAWQVSPGRLALLGGAGAAAVCLMAVVKGLVGCRFRGCGSHCGTGKDGAAASGKNG